MNLKKYIGNRAFYKSLLAVMLPILVQNGITNFISLLDNVMVGQVGTEQMSGVSIVNQLLFVFYLCIFGAISGAGLFSAQFFGKGDHEGVRHTFRFKLYSSLVLYALAMGIFLALGEPLIELYLHEGGETGDIALTMRYAKEYLAISLIGLLPYTVTQIYAGTLRETGHTVPPMLAGILGVLVNLSLNYVLIFGKLGAPTLGVEGAAIATVIARFAEGIALILWTHAHPQKCEFIKGVYRSWRVPSALMKQILRTGTPLLLNETVWAAGQAVLLQCYSVRGIAVVSAMNITNTIFNTFSVLFMAVGSAVAILLGHQLGAGRRQQAREDATKMIAFSLLMGCLTAGLVAICASFFPNLYNTTDEVRRLATQLTLVAALTAPLHAYLHSTYFTIRSGGKTLITFLFDSGYVWAVSVVIAFTLSNFTAIPAVTVYLICQLADLLKALLGTLLVRSGTWANDITKIPKHG
ncbi:MAG: MATE family efflux transporter [Clostridia bacterium]|nr:MATE family efflux transporter [Clostridia bacterium]